MTREPARVPCRSLRWKQRYAGPKEPGAFQTSHCWCVRTMGPQGPDGGPVSRQACDAGRPCFEEALGSP